MQTDLDMNKIFKVGETELRVRTEHTFKELKLLEKVQSESSKDPTINEEVFILLCSLMFENLNNKPIDFMDLTDKQFMEASKLFQLGKS